MITTDGETITYEMGYEVCVCPLGEHKEVDICYNTCVYQDEDDTTVMIIAKPRSFAMLCCQGKVKKLTIPYCLGRCMCIAEVYDDYTCLHTQDGDELRVNIGYNDNFIAFAESGEYRSISIVIHSGDEMLTCNPYTGRVSEKTRMSGYFITKYYFHDGEKIVSRYNKREKIALVPTGDNEFLLGDYKVPVFFDGKKYSIIGRIRDSLR